LAAKKCKNTGIKTLLNSAPAHDLKPPPKAMKFFAVAIAPVFFRMF
jgi:hypothetical protein